MEGLVQVLMMTLGSKETDNPGIWPQYPYKGLSYYEPQDKPIFAGRENDLRRFAYLISKPTKKVIILHGKTGCGKSSFLRANVIPFLEKNELGFQFFKHVDQGKNKALFVRSTDAPLAVLSDTLFKFISEPYKLKTLLGETTVDLSNSLMGYKDNKTFKENAGTNAEIMKQALGNLSVSLPRTLVIIIDQCEEVLTIKPGNEGEKNRSHFF